MTSRITAYAPSWLAAAQGAAQSSKTAGDILRRKDENRRREASHMEEIRRAQEARQDRQRQREQEEAESQAIGAMIASQRSMEGLSPRHAEMLRSLEESSESMSPEALRWALGQVRGQILSELEAEEEQNTTRMIQSALGNGVVDEGIVSAINQDLAEGKITHRQAKQKLREAASVAISTNKAAQERESTMTLLQQNLQASAGQLAPDDLKELETLLEVEMATGETPVEELGPKFLHSLADSMEKRSRETTFSRPTPPMSFPNSMQPPAEKPKQDPKRARYWSPEKQRDLQVKIEGVIGTEGMSSEEKHEKVRELVGDAILPGSVWVTIARLIKESNPTEQTMKNAQERIQDEEREGKPGAGTALEANQGRSLKGKGGRQPEG